VNTRPLLDFDMISEFSLEMFNELVEGLQNRYKAWDGVNQFKGTSRRLLDMYEELCWLPEKIKRELDEETRLFEDGYEETVHVTGIEVPSLCPHHLLPCMFTVDILHIPQGRVLGLSKFARIAMILGKRPILQEMYTRELVNELWERTNPKGVKVRVVGVHACMTFRGPRQKSEVETVQQRGEI